MIIKNPYINSDSKNIIIRKSFVKKLILLLLLFVIIGLGYVASQKVKTKGYNGLWDFITSISSGYWNGRNVKPEAISIEIKDKYIKLLEKNRQQALERGVIINDLDGEYVPAELTYQKKKIKVKLRLKGHMTDHLQENKWSFRIKIKDKDSFMGMKRFSIQHPGTRGYIHEWIYHQLMKREDIIALRYKFINVSVNGKDWGIYAVEENFEDELLENNQRKIGPIMRFNPDLYWVNRYNMLLKQSSYDEFASYYSANPEAYREDKVLKDSVQQKYYFKAIALIEGVRNKKITIEEAFDIERLAKFHAIIDLVGGQHSIDWSDLKYYYNPVTQKLEPIAYESFTDFTTREISGNYKYVMLDSNQNYRDWHTNLFSNTAFFKAYVHQLEKVSEPEYLDKFFSESEKELKDNLSILNSEFPYKKFDKQGYYRNQKMIKKILTAPKHFHAYFKNVSGNTIYLQIGAIESLPVEIQSLNVGMKVIKPTSPIILSSKQSGQYVRYKNYEFSMPTGMKWNDSLIEFLNINYTVLGSSVNREAKVFVFPHIDNEYISSDLKNKQANIKQFSFLTIDETNKVIVIKPGKQVITQDMIIPQGYTLIANGDVSIDLKNTAKIISYSPLIFNGLEGKSLAIESTDSTGQGIILINASNSQFNYVVFKNLPKVNDKQWNRSGYLTFYESSVNFSYCNFYNSKADDAVNIIRSDFSFKHCLFNNMGNDAINIDFSKGTITNCVFENLYDNALDITMSHVNIQSMYVNTCKTEALNVKNTSTVIGSDIKIKNSTIAVAAKDISDIKISKLTLSGLKQNFLKEKKSNITVDGVEVKDEINPVSVNKN